MVIPRIFVELFSRKYNKVTYVVTKAKVLNVLTDKTKHITKNKEWYGIFIDHTTKRYLLTSYKYTQGNDGNISLKNYKDSGLLFSLKTMDAILASMKKQQR